MAFTPADTRRAQLRGAEDLLLSIDPAKAYPFDFVVFRITGYHPRSADDPGELLTGLALQHDLGLLIEQVSDTLDEQTVHLAEPVLQIDDVATRFNVTSKTIQRWRRRGLAARKFIFPDGKRRVGFLLGSVERFLAGNQEQVSRGANFSQVGDAERDEIVRRARRLAEGCHCCINEICRRLARKLNRSPLTILHTIRKHDEEHPDEAVFPHAAEPVADAARLRILRSYRQGQSLTSLSRRWCQTRSSIYRVIVDERVARVTKRKVKFIDDPLYHQPDAAEVIDALLKQNELPSDPSGEAVRIPRDLPPYLQDLYREPLLTPARERSLFLKYNFHKFQFVTARRRLEPQFAKARDLVTLERLLRRAVEVKNQIVRANLRLVVSVARKHLRPGLNLMELVSDGNLTLMRAVESFDIHKGVRFSTYGTLALMKGFARSVPQMQAATRRNSGSIEKLLEVPDGRLESVDQRLGDRDQVRAMLQRLSDRERRVVAAHFGIDLRDASQRAADAAPVEPASYDELAVALGLSKQRVRQIEQAALEKLRAAAAPAAPR
jgi:RNA polymerase sigma factor (sigma-70 family)